MTKKKFILTKKEKRIKILEEKLSFFEGKLYSQMSDYEGEITESISSKLKHQEMIMLNVAIDDLKTELDELES